jgi:hypothetical protein
MSILNGNGMYRFAKKDIIYFQKLISSNLMIVFKCL